VQLTSALFQVGFRRTAGGSDRVTPFLTVDYSVGTRLDDELILTGRAPAASDDDDDDDDDDAWNYTVRSLVNQTQSHRSVSGHLRLRRLVASYAQ